MAFFQFLFTIESRGSQGTKWTSHNPLTFGQSQKVDTKSEVILITSLTSLRMHTVLAVIVHHVYFVIGWIWICNDGKVPLTEYHEYCTGGVGNRGSGWGLCPVSGRHRLGCASLWAQQPQEQSGFSRHWRLSAKHKQVGTVYQVKNTHSHITYLLHNLTMYTYIYSTRILGHACKILFRSMRPRSITSGNNNSKRVRILERAFRYTMVVFLWMVYKIMAGFTKDQIQECILYWLVLFIL